MSLHLASLACQISLGVELVGEGKDDLVINVNIPRILARISFMVIITYFFYTQAKYTTIIMVKCKQSTH